MADIVMSAVLAQVAARVEHDSTFTSAEASVEIAQVFASATNMVRNQSFLDEIVQLMKNHAIISKEVFDILIQKHNAISDEYAGDELIFIPGCCCCGLQPDGQVVREVTDSLDNMDLGALGEMGEKIREYRDGVHDNFTTFAKKDALARAFSYYFFERLTSPTKITENEAVALYNVFQVNECVADELMSLVKMGVSMTSLVVSSPGSTSSPIASRLRQAFGVPLIGGGGSGGGGGGCCCCCCCCGGGC
jgi:hypothetical protein